MDAELRYYGKDDSSYLQFAYYLSPVEGEGDDIAPEPVEVPAAKVAAVA